MARGQESQFDPARRVDRAALVPSISSDPRMPDDEDDDERFERNQAKGFKDSDDY